MPLGLPWLSSDTSWPKTQSFFATPQVSIVAKSLKYSRQPSSLPIDPEVLVFFFFISGCLLSPLIQKTLDQDIAKSWKNAIYNGCLPAML
jgi:hypothetical protein